jgi:hypothetical protein
MDQWTLKVTARRQMGELLKLQPERMRFAKLLTRDVQPLIDHGLAAEAADAEQKEQHAESAAARTAKSATAKALFARETELRNVIAAIVDDLMDEDSELASFLALLSFARFRIRELEPPPTAPAEGGGDAPASEEIRAVARVKAEDHVTRALGLGRYCRALLKPGREAIVAKLVEREITREELEQLAADAEALAEAGRNIKRAAEATAREAAAAAAQRRKWNAIRRLVSVAVRGDPALEAKFAEC